MDNNEKQNNNIFSLYYSDDDIFSSFYSTEDEDKVLKEIMVTDKQQQKESITTTNNILGWNWAELDEETPLSFRSKYASVLSHYHLITTNTCDTEKKEQDHIHHQQLLIKLQQLQDGSWEKLINDENYYLHELLHLKKTKSLSTNSSFNVDLSPSQIQRERITFRPSPELYAPFVITDSLLPFYVTRYVFLYKKIL